MRGTLAREWRRIEDRKVGERIGSECERVCVCASVCVGVCWCVVREGKSGRDVGE